MSLRHQVPLRFVVVSGCGVDLDEMDSRIAAAAEAFQGFVVVVVDVLENGFVAVVGAFVVAVGDLVGDDSLGVVGADQMIERAESCNGDASVAPFALIKHDLP